MTARQLMLPANRAFNANGLAVSGAQCKLYTTGTTTPQPFYADAGLTTSLGTTLTANAAGRFPTAYQDGSTPFRLKVIDGSGATLDDIDPFYFGQTIYDISGSVTAASRTILASMTGSTGSTVYLTESGREGSFVWSSSNLSSKVTADTRQAVYVAPASDTTGASGAWVRVYDNRLKIKWFGPVMDGVTDDSAAVLAAYALAVALQGDNLTGYATACPSIEFPFTPHGINMGSTTISITKAISTYGEAASEAGGAATWLKWTGNCNGFELRAGNCHIDGLGLKGPWTAASNAEGEYHAIKAYYRFSYGRLYVDSWRGDGVHIDITAGSGGDTEGNANAVRGQWLGAFNCRRALYTKGGDANAGMFDFVDANYCRQAGVMESSFLGNAYGCIQTAGCGVQGYGDPTCSFNSGHIFYVISGQETGASTNSPPATATSNTWWGYWKDAGAATSYAPQWVSGTTYRAGGGLLVPLTQTSNCSTIDFLYTESDQPPTQTAQNTLVKGGLNAAGNGSTNRYITANLNGVAVAPAFYVTGPFTQIYGNNNQFLIDATAAATDPLFKIRNGNASGKIQFENSSAVIQGSILTSNTLGMFVDATVGVTLRFNGTNVVSTTTNGLNMASGKTLSVNGTQVVSSRATGWAADTGTAKRTANATYTGGAANGTYLQAEITTLKNAVQDISQALKALKDDLITHGLIGA